MPNPTVPCQYRTGKTLGTGTYYISKEAIHIETGKYYGCKIIRKTAMQGRGHLVRNEIAVLKRVKSDNPNIVKLHDYFETMHSVYLCLDLCTGGTLFDRIRDKGTYPEAKTADLVRTILIAVKHIHNSGIEHRDLNPKTLHFRSLAEGAPIMIADFGHGRLTEEIREGRDDGEMKLYGVHRYMAPEVFVKPNHSKPVDVWGVGLLAFFMIAGYTPFDRDRVQLETDAIVAGEYKFAPGEKWDNISVNAREFIGMCLTVDPDRRPTAKDALAHTWLVPPTPRVIQVKSRTASLLELRLPYFKKVFNPKRKWRIVVLTIKALNRMHTLAGHPLPSTQQDADEEATGQDSSSIYSAYFESTKHVDSGEQEHYRNSHEDQTSFSSTPGEGDIADFPSPVSSVYTFDDQESWLTRTSMSTSATDDEIEADMSSAHNDSSYESFPPSDSIRSDSVEKDMTPNTAQLPSTASSVYTPGISASTESTSSQSTADQRPISTFVIYTPNDLAGDHPAVSPEDVQILEDKFAEGGLVVSTHRPTQAEAWVEDHYDDPLLESARSVGLGGPIAVMLSPEVPALAIFGSILDDGVLHIARTLADVSQFAVMVRPIADNPIARFAGPGGKDEGLSGILNPSVPEHRLGDGESDSEGVEEGEGEDEDGEVDGGEPQFAYAEGPAMRIRGGRGDDSGEDDMSVPWTSKAHKSVVWLNLWPDEKHEYSLGVRTKTTFQFQPEYPEDNSTKTQPEVIGRVKLNVETRAKVLPDRSYTSLGFLAHRERTLIDREFIDCGFDHPDQTLKSIEMESTQLTATVNMGAMNLHPAGGASATYSNTRGKAAELADNKPTPRCAVFHDPGERWNKEGKSYTSYDITTVPGKDPRTRIKNPLLAEFAMGVNILHEKDVGPPEISFVTRNQVIIWIWDPTLKPTVRGLLVLMTTYIPNIRTRQELVIQEDWDVHFASDATKNNMPGSPMAAKAAKDKEAMALSLSIAPIQTKKSRKDALSELFTDVRNKFGGPKEPTLANLPLQEYISRGWDATNETWRPAVWTSLDKDFRTPDLEVASKSPAWKVGWNPREPEEPDSEGSEEKEEEKEQDHDVVDGNPFGHYQGKGKGRDMGGAETLGEVVAGPSTNIDD